MQHRMKTHPLTEDRVANLLLTSSVGSLATLNNDGSQYVIPVHFLYYNDGIYIHGLPKGQKIDNIKGEARVSMTVYKMDTLLLDPDGKPCDTNTKYESVIISGTATLVEDLELKKEVLIEITKKYTPHLGEKALPDNMVKGTAVIKIDIQTMTGKYYG